MALIDVILKNEVYSKQIAEFISLNYKKVQKYKKNLLAGKWLKLMRKSPMFRLAAVAECLEDVKCRYDELSISEEIFYDTMNDIKIWVDDYYGKNHKLGLHELNWIRLHINLEIFKIGRLQFQTARYWFNKKYTEDNKIIAFGEKCLNIHIPRGEKLDIEKCKESVIKARKFFSVYFPEIRTDIMMCHSWLLYSKNSNFMEQDSNIIKFSKLFHIVSEHESPSQPLLWMFGITQSDIKLLKSKRKNSYYYPLNDLKPVTSMQKKAVKYLSEGGIIGDAKGILKDF